MIKSIKSKIIILSIYLTPAFAWAQVNSPNNFADVVQIFLEILEIIFAITIVLALVVFFWGLAKFIYSAGDPEAVKNGKQLMIWGIVGIFVMVSLFGILVILGNTFNLEIGIPLLPTG